MDAFNRVGNGDFSQSLVRHRALTGQNSEPVSWSVSVAGDTGKVIAVLSSAYSKTNVSSVCQLC